MQTVAFLKAVSLFKVRVLFMISMRNEEKLSDSLCKMRDDFNHNIVVVDANWHKTSIKKGDKREINLVRPSIYDIHRE